MSDIDIKDLRAKAEAATPGPWGWFSSTRHSVYLATTHSGRTYVMDFVRHGMQGAQPRFRKDHIMVKAEEIPIFAVCAEATSADDERVYRTDITGFRSPDATYIAAANPAVLLQLLDDLEAAYRALAWIGTEAHMVRPENYGEVRAKARAFVEGSNHE